MTTGRQAPPGARTSQTHPIRVDWIDDVAIPSTAWWTGCLGMTFLPGKRDHGISGHHWRDLEVDVARLRADHQTDACVLLVEDHELQATGTADIGPTMQRHGVNLIRFPIVDGEDDTERDRAPQRDPDQAPWNCALVLIRLAIGQCQCRRRRQHTDNRNFDESAMIGSAHANNCTIFCQRETRPPWPYTLTNIVLRRPDPR